MSDFAKVMVARFLAERKVNHGVGASSGYLYMVPTMLKDFIEAVNDDPIPQQVSYRVATGVGNRSLLEFHLPSYLWGFTEDLSAALSGPMMEPCKESVIYDRGDYIRQKSGVRLRHDRQFEMHVVSSRKTESQRWLESLGFETLGEMFVSHRREFEEWIKMVVLTSARCKPVSSEEMTAIECLIGAGTWQRVIPVRVVS